MELKDSGKRREFKSGAVRDIQEGKGRCDLLPLDIIGEQFHDSVLALVGEYIYSGNVALLTQAVENFSILQYKDGDRANRLSNIFLEVSKHYEDGCNKYGDRNWEKGIDLHCYIDSGVRHYLKHMRGDTDEPHDRAFVWNMLGAIWTQKHRPDLIDLPFGKE